ncbi:hypothetical protein [Ferruginibacter sp. HRS2-29]|uniref:hypothetical protein n=1 Tax=Ferruginibacter sp. HRS2-29 TaxID=2487334 RepID=UPI0020CEBD29|nr:hypothetical protein [Ferruginibacter sp. HRS2-29]MCP9752184.1 hypothetical protein [Ferruginibacter sp. HRS2-29]
MLKCLLTTLLSASIFSSSVLAQTPEKDLESVKKDYTRESIYFHYDKDNYVAGETVWFKAYLFAGVSPSFYSTSLNVELLNDSGRVISRKILPVLAGSAVGNFDLDKDLPQMNYTVRAYTRRMQNFGNIFFYEKQLQVFNPSKAIAKSSAAETRAYFLPEGGNMVAGLPAVVAFKMSDQYGTPVYCEGEVVDREGNNVAIFKTVHDGMGKFAFIPQPDQSYTAICNFPGGMQKIALPAVKISGFSLMIQTAGDKKFFIVNKEKVSNDNQRPAYLLGVMENTVLFRQDLSSAGMLVKGQLPLATLPSGILQLTVFNKEDQPLAERMLFVGNNEFLVKGIFKADTVSLVERKKNSFSFTVEDSIPGTYSVSVTDVDREIPTDNRENIISRLMLTNDIKGYIHNPLYYFENDNQESREYLDLVMMTNGWRNFSWAQIISKNFPGLSYKDENYISAYGKAYYAPRNNVMVTNADMNVFMSSKDSSNEFFTVHIDEKGDFKIPGMIFQDSAKMSFQLNTAKNKSISLSMYNLPLSKLFVAAPRPIYGEIKPVGDISSVPGISSTVKELYGSSLARLSQDDEKRLISLQEIRLASVKAKSKTSIVQQRYLTGLFSTGYGKTLDFITYPESGFYRNVFEYLKGRESSLSISGSGSEYFINYRATRSLAGGLLPMTIFIDGVQSDTYYAATIPMRDIAVVQIRGSGFVGAEGGGAGGVLAIFTRKGGDILASPRDNLSSLSIEGYATVKEFFSPDYSVNNNKAVPDNRTTLYWNPYLETSAENKTLRIPFYNSDHAKKFRVTLTGMNAEGKLLYMEKIIE